MAYTYNSAPTYRDSGRSSGSYIKPDKGFTPRRSTNSKQELFKLWDSLLFKKEDLKNGSAKL